MKTQKKSDKDRFSDLPDHVLLHIIEFMNIKDSVQTCVLSKRWKDLWKSLTNLELDQHYLDSSDMFNKFVSHFLFGRENSLPLHSLTYYATDPSKTAVLDVIKYAASHNVQQLTVNVCLLFTETDFEIPPSIFCCHSLTSLKLDFSNSWHSYDTDSKNMFPKSLNLPALKTLHLICLTFTTNNNGCAEPFSRCNMLITLVIMGCYLQDDAQTLFISNSNITSLAVSTYNYKVVFYTPKLTSLTITGHPTSLAPSASNFPLIEEVNVDYTFFDIPYGCLVMSSWLQLLANVKIITLGLDTLERILNVLKIMVQEKLFVRLKSLKVKLKCNSTMSIEEVRGMTNYLLQNSLQTTVDILPCWRYPFRKCCHVRILEIKRRRDFVMQNLKQEKGEFSDAELEA